jgi:hypothetical protein
MLWPVTSLPFILACVVLAAGFFMAGAAWASVRRHRPDGRLLWVEVSRSSQEHCIAVSAEDKHGWLTYERVDLREDGYEEKLAVAVVEMKHKLATIEAAQRIALEP